MTREQVDALLASYRVNVGRSAHLETEIMELTEKIRKAENDIVDDLALHGVGISDMPKGNQTGNPTERIAIGMASGEVPALLKDGYEELRMLQAQQKELAMKISYVDSWFKGLNSRESWVIHKQVIDREFWRDVVVEYMADYNESASKDRLKRMKSEAMSKVYAMAGVI